LQVEQVNQVFHPSTAEVDWAKRVLDAVNAAQGQAISLDGKMIDLPVIRRAEQVLQASVE
jgi:citrate lyase subunit beta/citryl-CoA lyase